MTGKLMTVLYQINNEVWEVIDNNDGGKSGKKSDRYVQAQEVIMREVEKIVLKEVVCKVRQKKLNN